MRTKVFRVQLTPHEVSTLKEMVTASEYRHMPLRTLAVYAQRAGKVFASATTWAKLVRQRGWRRPRRPIISTGRPLSSQKRRRDSRMFPDAAAVDAGITATEAHMITDRIEENLKARFSIEDVTIHVEPDA